jgi:hypothetical protein
MSFTYQITSSVQAPAAPVPDSPAQVPDLLRQILEVQREQLAQLKASAAAHDNSARWKAFLGRWQQDFPNLAADCRHALPLLERAYGALIAELAERLRDSGGLDDDFELSEFLDRYGMRLGQLGTLLSVVAFLAEAAQSEPSS